MIGHLLVLSSKLSDVRVLSSANYLLPSIWA
jgi:hypothetical protein